MFRLDRFRFILIICVPVVILGVMEYADPNGVGSELTPESFSDVWQELQPDDDESLRLRARDMIDVGKLQEARDLLELALRRGVKTNEDLYYDYVILLKVVQAEDPKLKGAVAAWRRNFPHSDRPDPTWHEKMRWQN